MKKLKVAYFGTPYFSALFLDKLLSDTSIKRLIEVKFVVTQPDQPVGRNQTITKSPVKIVAEKFNLPVFDSEVTEIKEKLAKLDISFLYAYGGKLTAEIINLPKYGFWNTHPSLLPKYRGALPIAMPLILGDKETGVTLIKLDEKVDHGPIIAQEKLAINPHVKKSDLEAKLTYMGYSMFKELISKFKTSGFTELKTKTQDHDQSTFTYQLKKNDGFVELLILKKAFNNEKLVPNELPKLLFNYLTKYNLTESYKSKIENSSKIVYDYFRGLHPWPGLWTIVDIKGQPHSAEASRGKQKRLKITALSLQSDKLIIKKVQLEGKKEVDFKTFNSAYSVF